MNDALAGVRRWLWVVLAMIFAMVIVGGITRLTGSGLSMVEWHPLMGALPPLSDGEWQRVFAQYQISPQYAQVNSWMELEHFQRIFFWEYVHRLLGRLIGVVFALPFVAFLVRRRLRGRVAWFAAIAFFLGGAQGLLGWYMVKSGLVDVPEVSHFRLAAHLGLAFLTGQYVLWLALELRPRSEVPEPASRAVRFAILGTAVLLAVQIAYGAFMAGQRAGHVAYTFPDMNGFYGPGPFFTGDSVLTDALHSPSAIHWLHRGLAYLLVLAIIGLFVTVRRSSANARVRRGASVVLGVAALQLLIGVGVVMMHVAVSVAVVHQAGAFVLSCALTALAWEAGALPRAKQSSPPEA